MAEATRERITDKDPAVKLARKRLSVLQLSQELGRVSKACKQAGMDRTSFYEWKRRFQTHGLDGLRDLPPIHKNHPQTTPEATQERLVELALTHPTRGCNYLASLLAQEGVAVSFVTVQNVLNKRGLGSRYERLLALEKKALANQIEPDRTDAGTGQADRTSQPVFQRAPRRVKPAGRVAVPGHVFRGPVQGSWQSLLA